MEENKVETEQKDDDKIHLSQIIVACMDFEKDPTEEKQKIIDGLVGSLQIKSYMPLQEKELALMKIITRIPDDYDAPGATVYIEMCKVIYGLLSYCINLDNDFGGIAIQYGLYDMLMNHEVVGYILDYCAEDFAVLEKMVDEAINFHNLFRLTQTAALFSDEAYEKWSKMIIDLKTTITPELMDSLKTVAVEGSPEWKTLRTTVADNALGQALQKDIDHIAEGLKRESQIKLPADDSRENK